MRLTPFSKRGATRLVASGEEGFTMIFAILTLLISGLLVASAFTAASGDISLTRNSTLQAKAYYAALSGVQRYQHQIASNPNYWIECEKIGTETEPKPVTGTTDETYYVKTLGSTGHTVCEKGKQATTLEATGAAKGTFRILSTGIAGSGSSAVKRLIVATFAHPGFTKYVYESNYEVEDPSNFEPEPTECEHYYAYRSTHSNAKGEKLTEVCPVIQFAPEDKVNGPMHTNDAAAVCNSPTFGRSLADPIEMNGGHYAAGGCKNEPNILGKYTETGSTLLPPETDLELLETAGLKEEGRTELVLETGSPNKIKISHKPGEEPITVPFPSNGVIYVENSASGCGVAKYTPFGSDVENDAGCGNVYVHGEYTESLTIASADDVIVNGDLTTTSSSTSTPPGEPTGGATLGLIAENFVRVYHPVKKTAKTENVVPPTGGFTHNGKCVTQVTPEQRSGTIAKSTVSAINTTGLKVGQEVEGTGIEAGTTISSVDIAGKKIILSKPAKPTAEALGKTLRTTEVTGITTAGLEKGMEVEGTGLVAGTTISKVEAGNKIILSTAAKPPVEEVTSTTKTTTTEVTVSSSGGLEVGQEVEGNGIPANTKITEVKSSTKIKISNKPTTNETNIKLKYYGENPTLKFYRSEAVSNLKFYEPNGYQYNATKNVCHEEKPLNGSPYDKYIESENRYIENCATGTVYVGEGLCKYTIKEGSCSSKATNLSESEDPNKWGIQPNLTVDAAILSTNHSWIVDNYECGASLGKLTVWGSIAQFWRGPVGRGSAGYIKSYNYDERLATQQPPSFLSPSSTSWALARETAPPTGFKG